MNESLYKLSRLDLIMDDDIYSLLRILDVDKVINN